MSTLLMASLCVAGAPGRSAVGLWLALRAPTSGTSRSGIDVLVPVLVAIDLAAHGGEEHFLDLAGDGAGLADLAVVDRADRDDLGGGAREERLVGGVEVGAQDVPGRALDAEVAGDRH